MSLGKRIKQFREAAGYTQDELVDLMRGKPSITTLKSWENDRTEPKVSEAKAIADIIKCDPIKLILGDCNLENEFNESMKHTLKEMQGLPLEYTRVLQKIISATALTEENARRLKLMQRFSN